MMKSLPKLIFVCGLFSLTNHVVTKAQTQSSACPPAEKSIHLLWVGSLTGCPFSAVIDIGRTQTLADGSHIQTKTKDLVYRDSLGRIRYEMYGPAVIDKSSPEAPTIVRIYDPVAGFEYVLQPQSAIAYRNSLNEPTTSQRAGAKPQLSFAQASASPPRPKMTVEKLEPQHMEGLLVTGRRTTRTIPAGAEGNDQALTIVSESWISSDMGITLLEKTSDPRSGDSERRMTNLEQSEPDAALFQVPAEYTIK
jgi:hypothetical protein